MTPERRAKLFRWVGAGVIALVALFSLAVNILPIITNDSLEYIAFSRDPGQYGSVFIGYRQIGYPITLLVERSMASAVGIETLLFTALFQKLVLMSAVAYAIWLWRWKATPVVFLVLTPSFLIYTNFILTEGMSVPLGLLLACLVSHSFRLTVGPERETGDGDGWAVFLVAMVGLVAFSLLSFRYPFAVFGAAPALILAGRYFGTRRAIKGTAVVVAAFIAVSALFSYVLAAENADEYGVFSPSTRGKRSQYWGTWHVVFTLHPENRDNPDLAEYWDGGSLYPHVNEVDSIDAGYEVQAEIYETDIDQMLQLAGLDRSRERLFSFLGALRGGRIDDLEKHIVPSLEVDARTVDVAIYRNTLARQEGASAFDKEYNEGHRPQAVVTSPAFPDFPAPYLQDLIRWLLPAAILGVLVLTVTRRQWWLGAAFLIPVIVHSAGMGWILMDNVRFLLPVSVYGVAGFSALWSSPNLRAVSSDKVPVPN